MKAPKGRKPERFISAPIAERARQKRPGRERDWTMLPRPPLLCWTQFRHKISTVYFPCGSQELNSLQETGGSFRGHFFSSLERHMALAISLLGTSGDLIL